MEAKIDRLLPAPAAPRLKPHDRELLAVLLPEIAALGMREFSVAGLRTIAVTTQNNLLADALDACGNGWATGNLFARAAGCDIDGYEVRRVSLPRENPTRWHISKH